MKKSMFHTSLFLTAFATFLLCNQYTDRKVQNARTTAYEQATQKCNQAWEDLLPALLEEAKTKGHSEAEQEFELIIPEIWQEGFETGVDETISQYADSLAIARQQMVFLMTIIDSLQLVLDDFAATPPSPPTLARANSKVHWQGWSDNQTVRWAVAIASFCFSFLATASLTRHHIGLKRRF